MGREKGNKMTVSECCFICMLTATYIFRSGKSENTLIDTDSTVYAVFTPVVISHIVNVCYKKKIICS